MHFVDETDSGRGMMFSQQFTFGTQTRKHCPLIVKPFHPPPLLKKKSGVKQWAFKLNNALVTAENWHLKCHMLKDSIMTAIFPGMTQYPVVPNLFGLEDFLFLYILKVESACSNKTFLSVYRTISCHIQTIVILIILMECMQ